MPPDHPTSGASKILILGGTTEARALAERLVAEGHHVITSLAGRTADPAIPPGDIRIGGFGGVDGLVRYLREEKITRVIDATHPFARQVSENTATACAAAGVPLETVDRPQWQPQPGDQWIDVSSLTEAAAALPAGATVFLALGRQYISAFEGRDDCHFVVRMVDRPEHRLPFRSHDLLLGKPSPDAAKEAALFTLYRITHLVARNSGGDAGYGKIAAARALGIPVMMIGR
ncbi:cobalt-precorrin-6A reductase [Ciceribacter sp. L1K23]|uniref:cobalt-precorrin-6A reductase n=1 Tax=Ciceribacter sp. L1K23 TaxID=2820276 RepID=UPI001B824EC9|nr:cobalt-precorrin-6A reductase [Ciceribacter sp. L1K23]MBR0555400.1 cobalt-precorrin-6A reductase [Ciceribacter sp. L1K23]